MKNTLIKDTSLSIRCINCLHAADIRTTDDLKAHIEKFRISDFVKFRHFGFKTFEELKKFVEENKLIENEIISISEKAIKYQRDNYNYANNTGAGRNLQTTYEAGYVQGKQDTESDSKKLAIEFAEWHLKLFEYNYEKWVELTTTELFDKFIEQRNE